MLISSPPQVALLETSPYLLALTIIVSIVHSVFEFLAFKNGRHGSWDIKVTAEGSISSLFLLMPGVSHLMGWRDSDPTRHRAEGGAGPAAWAKARVATPGSRAGNSKAKGKGNPRVAPGTLPVRKPQHASTQFQNSP